MKKIIKRALLTILLIIIIITIVYWPLVQYGYQQAKGQLNIIWNAREVEKVMRDPKVADSVKNRIKLAQKVRDYGIDSLGLNNSDSYTSYYDQKGEPVLWVVTACKPFELKNKEWGFPFIGTFSYKGFFNHESALRLKEELAKKGYDTGIRTVSAWSTLGIFDDPILSNVLFRSDGDLANIILHELTHATIFVKDSLQFNENLATFIGHEGAKNFLKDEFGAGSKAFKDYEARLHDRNLFTNHILKGADRLDSLYNTFSEDMDSLQKARKKRHMIKTIIESADTLDFSNRGNYPRLIARLSKEGELPNNTYFMSYRRYRKDQEQFRKMFRQKFDQDINKMIDAFKSEYGK